MNQFYAHRNGNTMECNCIALIGVGANLPAPDSRPPPCEALAKQAAKQGPLQTCRIAVAMLDLIPGVRLRGLSRWYLSAPVPPSGQPPYVNAVAALLVDRVDPADLLARLMAIETACGRRRSVANAARTLDLDIIAVGSLVRAAPDPILPHPRAHLRAFVLAPLMDVAPDWVHPVFGKTAAELLAELPPQDIQPLAV
jgi:2-amino-4-hydroxy-6-hydroxymethyldihydropteridine diphosphokinase